MPFMVQITKRFMFEAAHELPWHSGKCKHLHGHSYKLEVTLEGELNDNGIVLDFDDLSIIVNEMIVKRYDHQYLNDFFSNPTAEMIARSIYHDITLGIEKNADLFKGVTLAYVRLWETEKCFVTYGG